MFRTEGLPPPAPQTGAGGSLFSFSSGGGHLPLPAASPQPYVEIFLLLFRNSYLLLWN